ncbi:MAG: hypothetical protein HF978_18565 [Desulfobacteraceae bacterium]|nr:hypothetical protein [Desulfobacteraceae bacterium]MBC2757552.1 hypothetical protein [Desulfobacteraceae bacterium]
MRTFYKLLFAFLLTACLSCAHAHFIPLETNQITKGIHAGAPALPYYVYSKTALQVLDEEFKNSNSAITLEDTYDAAYKFSFEDIPADGNTGQAFENMETASRYLQNILKSRGVNDSENYFMTSIDTANSDGFILITAIYRHTSPIAVFNKFNFLLRQMLTPEDPEFYRPYRTDDSGKPLDIVYEWVALPIDCVSYQAYQAILLTLTANKILEQKAKNDYWSEERQWIAGNFLSVLIKQDIKVCQALGIEEGFTQHQKIYGQ